WPLCFCGLSGPRVSRGTQCRWRPATGRQGQTKRRLRPRETQAKGDRQKKVTAEKGRHRWRNPDKERERGRERIEGEQVRGEGNGSGYERRKKRYWKQTRVVKKRVRKNGTGESRVSYWRLKMLNPKLVKNGSMEDL
ncbi:hypothetical protein TGPRC2_425790, partial [Toxoplasma gondii TgCatPRC2]